MSAIWRIFFGLVSALMLGRCQSQPTVPEGMPIGNPCNETLDCLSNNPKGVICLEGTCWCQDPKNEIYDPVRKACVKLIGTPCTDGNYCVMNAACVNNFCSCNEGYSPYALSICKADYSIPCVEKDICDETRGLECKEGSCECAKDKEFLKELGACFDNNTAHTINMTISKFMESGILDMLKSKEFNWTDEKDLEILYNSVEPIIAFAAQSIIPSVASPDARNPQTGIGGFVSNVVGTSLNLFSDPNSRNGDLSGINRSVQDLIRSLSLGAGGVTGSSQAPRRGIIGRVFSPIRNFFSTVFNLLRAIPSLLFGNTNSSQNSSGGIINTLRNALAQLSRNEAVVNPVPELSGNPIFVGVISETTPASLRPRNTTRSPFNRN